MAKATVSLPSTATTSPTSSLDSAARLAPYTHQQADFYYYGLPSRPVFVASSHIEAWNPFTGSHPQPKALHPVGEHGIANIWEAALADQVMAYLTTNGVDWTSLDIVRIGINGEPAPIVLWIGVQPRTLSGEIGHNVALDIHKTLQENGITDIHVEIRESLIVKAAKLLTPLNMATSVAKVAWPITSTLGIFVCADSVIGTGGFFIARSGVTDKVFLVTARHVIAQPDLANNGVITHTATGQDRHEVSILSDATYEQFLALIKDAIVRETKIVEDPELRRKAKEDEEDEKSEAEHCITVARKAVLKLQSFYKEVVSKWSNSSDRILGHVILAPPIESSEHRVNPSGFTQDVAVIEVDKSRIDGSDFLGNVIDLGTEISSFDFTSHMNPNACHPRTFVYPAKRLLKVSGVIPVEELRHPGQLDKENNKCIIVLKNGVASGTTIGFADGLFSYTRHSYFGDIHIISKEWAIVGRDGPFSIPGDSGSVIVDGSGRFGGLLTGGCRGSRYHPNALDITYATPICFVLACLQEYGFDAHFDLPFVR